MEVTDDLSNRLLRLPLWIGDDIAPRVVSALKMALANHHEALNFPEKSDSSSAKLSSKASVAINSEIP